VRVSVWDEDAEQLYQTGDLVKGCEVDAEGRIRLNEWTALDGQKRGGLNLSAWKLELLGAVGRRSRPRRAPDGTLADVLGLRS
jgi:hypothetical protein